MSGHSGDDTERCILCGHEGHEEDGQADPADDDWYCETCLETSLSGETPLTDGGTVEGDGSRAHDPARERPPNNPHGGCTTATVAAAESQDGCEKVRVTQAGSSCYGGRR